MNQRGLTLIEILIVLAIMAGMLVLISGMGDRDYLGESTNEVSLLIAEGKLVALEKGLHHRLVVDIDSGTVWIEECNKPPLQVGKYQRDLSGLISGDRDAITKREVPDLQDLMTSGNIPDQFVAGLDPEKAVEAAKVLSGKTTLDGQTCVPAVTYEDLSLGMREQVAQAETQQRVQQTVKEFTPAQGPAAGQVKLTEREETVQDDRKVYPLQYQLPQEVKILAVFSRGPEPKKTEGIAYVPISPVGSTGRVVIELQETASSGIAHVALQGFNGRIDWQGVLPDPKEYVELDPTGERRAER